MKTNLSKKKEFDKARITILKPVQGAKKKYADLKVTRFIKIDGKEIF